MGRKSCVLGAMVSMVTLSSGVAMAQSAGSIGTGWNVTFLDTEEPGKDSSRIFGEIEYQTAIDEAARNWLGAVFASDAEAFNGGGLRYYRGDAEGTVFWGFGFGAYTLSGDSDLVSRTTVFLGGEMVVELHTFGDGDSTVPVTVFLGAYPSVAGDDGTMFRIGAKLKPNLFGSEAE